MHFYIESNIFKPNRKKHLGRIMLQYIIIKYSHPCNVYGKIFWFLNQKGKSKRMGLKQLKENISYFPFKSKEMMQRIYYAVFSYPLYGSWFHLPHCNLLPYYKSIRLIWKCQRYKSLIWLRIYISSLLYRITLAFTLHNHIISKMHFEIV